ncbi:MAG: tRNA lysidine(34) synthetase TilS [Gammaproteobacteria bacterium CG_4_10_14_0_8_um_filter_38_16]|nr:MAG: tRNA lysidine(34) synthetase TilS [Gammaproteobacteria bacterium CG_4_10_14_0_8_um_filter_38_16]PJA03359.1 MAG: tRNA lysidine(34) synthetase TilS [Gammaproteobacteria bacterium CG_4_10_14_0_2_um_filter_38_22]PJB10673.1 MAG: tRNA lysidine(34) synthetase TilS [Gammaproteobacteria bacterium CG_4_9_14_3_um_filter_38_9]
MFSAALIKKTIELQTTLQSFVVAYSGGLDSHVLLHVMSEIKKNDPKINVRAIHINHQVSRESHHWAVHCKKIGDALSIPIHVENIVLNLKTGDSFEENAREARYAALRKHIDKNSVLLTAHHLNDQAETFLLQALRGAGSKGLSAMPMKKKWGEGLLIRPLLYFSRDVLEAYARDHHLKWIEDDSNADTRFRRNFLRHEIFPLLKKQYPAVMNNFARSSRLVAAQEKIISEMIKVEFEKIKTNDLQKINLKMLRTFSDEKQKLLLREWFRENNQRMPNEKHLKQIQKDVIYAAPDSHPIFSLAGMTIKRDRLFLYMTSVYSNSE